MSMRTSNTGSPRFTVAFNGDISLFSRLSAFPEVESVFGKMTRDVIGGGRSSFYLADIDFDSIRASVAEAHEYGIRFIYLMNATCQGNEELTSGKNRALGKFADQLVDIGIDGVVVAAPYMLRFLKSRYPELPVSISTFCNVSSPTKARKWEDLGADRIILSTDINRNFTAIRGIRKAVNIEVEIFANNVCMAECPYSVNHPSAMAHSSESGKSGFLMDYHSFRCAKHKLEDPLEILRGGFLRPEDLNTYSDLGVDVFKLSGRSRSSDWILRTVQAFASGRYEGNLADLIVYPYILPKGEGMLSQAERWLLRPDLINLDALGLLQRLGERTGIVHIDNRKLDGFLDHFKKVDCSRLVCDVDCHHCRKVAAEAISYDSAQAEAQRRDLEALLEMLEGGAAFTENPLYKRIGATVVRWTTSRRNQFASKPTGAGTAAEAPTASTREIVEEPEHA